MTNVVSTHWYPHVHLLRAFAALSVLVYHVIELFPWQSFPTSGFLLWFRIGWMGVDIFFVISGFVIMLAALSQVKKNPVKARRDFFIRRCARLIPLYLLTAIVFMCIQPAVLFQPDVLKQLITHLLFIHNWWVSTHGSINGPNWSVAAEFQFYVLILLLMPYLAKLSIRTILIGGVLIAWATRYIMHTLAVKQGWPDAAQVVYATQVPMMVDMFACGMAIAAYVWRRPSSTKQVPWWKMLLLLVVTVGIAMLASDLFWSVAAFWQNSMMVIFWRTLLGIATGGILLLLVLLPPVGTRSWLHRIGFYLGDISYGIYLWHLPVILLLKRFVWNSPVEFLCATVVAVLVLASFSWHLLEKPCIQLAKRNHGPT